MYGYSVDLEYAHVTDLPDLMRVQQLHLACALIEIVAQGDAVVPALILPWHPRLLLVGIDEKVV